MQRLHFDITPSLDILLEPIAQGNCDMLGSQRGHLSPLAASARFNSVVSGPISFGADPCRRISSAPASRNAINWSAHCAARSEEHTSELQSLMRISYAVFCLKKKKNT